MIGALFVERGPILVRRLSQQLRQLRYVGRDLPRLLLRERPRGAPRRRT